ncbi:hypothetical protein CRYUN_Cryun36dG0057700 [Craigia yunnanensis]
MIDRGLIRYALGSKYWGKVIVTKAVKWLFQLSLKSFQMGIVQGLVDVDNKASQRILEKAGFEKEGTIWKCLILNGKITNVFVFSLLITNLL